MTDSARRYDLIEPVDEALLPLASGLIEIIVAANLVDAVMDDGR